MVVRLYGHLQPALKQENVPGEYVDGSWKLLPTRLFLRHFTKSVRKAKFGLGEVERCPVSSWWWPRTL